MLLAAYALTRTIRAWGSGFQEYDEYSAFYCIAQPPLLMVKDGLIHDSWFPLYFQFLRWAATPFHGVAQLAAGRGLVILTGLATCLGVCIYLRRRNGVAAAFLFALLLLLSPTNLTYTVTARPYMFMTAAFLACIIAAWEVIARGPWWSYIVLAGAGLPLVYTQAWGGILFGSVLGVAAGYLMLEKRWSDLGALVAAGAVVAIGFVPYLPFFAEQLHIGQKVDWSHVYIRFPLSVYLTGNIKALYGGYLGAAVLGILAVAALVRKGSRRGLMAFSALIVLVGIAFGVAYSQISQPIYNPWRQAVLFHGPVILSLSLLIVRLPRAWVGLGLLLLALNQGRLLIQVSTPSPRIDQLAAAGAILPQVDHGEALYFKDYVPYDGHFQICERLGSEGRYRLFTSYRFAWQERLIGHFLVQDLWEGRPVTVVLKVSKENRELLDRLRIRGLNAELKPFPGRHDLELARFGVP